MAEKINPWKWLLGLAGAIVGGTVGFYVFLWLVHQGLYAMIVPGAALGAGGAFLFKGRSQAFGIVCGILALMLGIFAEWWAIYDVTFSYFLAHLHLLKPVAFVMIALGGLCGYWFGQGQARIDGKQ